MPKCSDTGPLTIRARLDYLFEGGIADPTKLLLETEVWTSLPILLLEQERCLRFEALIEGRLTDSVALETYGAIERAYRETWAETGANPPVGWEHNLGFVVGEAVARFNAREASGFNARA